MIRRCGIAVTPLALLINVATADVVVELHSRVELERNVMRIRDLATLRGNKQEIGALGIINLPIKGKVGDTVQYRRSDIEKYILQQRSNLRERIRFSGAERVAVLRKGKSLSAEVYTKAAKLVLDQKLARVDEAITTQLAGSYRDLVIPYGVLRLEPRTETSNVRQDMKVWMKIEVDGQVYTSIPIAFKVNWPQLAYVLTRSGSAKSSFTEDMVTKAEVNGAAITGELATTWDQLQSKRLRHEVAAGAALRLEDIEEMPLIAAGEEVDVATQVGGVMVRTKAIAENDGYMGQIIKTRVAKTKEKLAVEVTGKGRAIVSSYKIY